MKPLYSESGFKASVCTNLLTTLISTCDDDDATSHAGGQWTDGKKAGSKRKCDCLYILSNAVMLYNGSCTSSL